MQMNTIEGLKARALAEAEKSPCNKRKVGAVIYDTNEEVVIGAGHNHTPDGSPCEINGVTTDKVIHAEAHAIIVAERGWSDIPLAMRNTDIYVTHKPCDNCAELIKKYGINNVIIVEKPEENFLKLDTDKLRFDLITPEYLEALAQVLTYGAEKYEPNNWRKIPEQDRWRLEASSMRHYNAHRKGEIYDEETGLTHLAHFATNIMFLLHLQLEELSTAEKDN